MGAGGAAAGQGGNMIGMNTTGPGSVNMAGNSASGGAQTGQPMVIGMPSSQVTGLPLIDSTE